MLTALIPLVTFMSASETALVWAILANFRVIPLAIDSEDPHRIESPELPPCP